ncbi:tyrosine aminotransferase-like [Ziziphus jujuba]|uniref:Tyrosine aminotransferase-like n=1 Tax=Ziziphus jujuba TaxID=326968 RepID=A0ABM4A777_ZIZJJ|nr:tyrosine aminotransferase-like [Ziziphus jujuba]
MEEALKKWNFEGVDGSVDDMERASAYTVRGVVCSIMDSLNGDDMRTVVRLGHGDPSNFPSFRTCTVAEDAIVDALRSAKYNHYSVKNGILPARRAMAEYLSRDLPYKLSPDDVYLTVGCEQAIDVILTVLSRPAANVLLPRPGFPLYEARAACCSLEVRHYNLLPGRDWEVDLEAVEALSDENTVAIVIINPGNPCGSVYKHQHLEKVTKMARKLRILVIADEVYNHLTFGTTPFVPMGVFGSTVPVITLGSISKRWFVPGWRLGWLVTSDPNGILKKSGVAKNIMGYLYVSANPATFIQVKLNLSFLEDIDDDMDFCIKLAKEESVIVLPGVALGLKNWIRITFAIEPSTLEDGFGRIKHFSLRHKKKQ